MPSSSRAVNILENQTGPPTGVAVGGGGGNWIGPPTGVEGVVGPVHQQGLTGREGGKVVP